MTESQSIALDYSQEYPLEECIWDWIELAKLKHKPNFVALNRHNIKREIIAALRHFRIINSANFIDMVRK